MYEVIESIRHLDFIFTIRMIKTIIDQSSNPNKTVLYIKTC